MYLCRLFFSALPLYTEYYHTLDYLDPIAMLLLSAMSLIFIHVVVLVLKHCVLCFHTFVLQQFSRTEMFVEFPSNIVTVESYYNKV